MSMNVKDVLEQTDWPALRKQMDAVRGLAGADPHTTMQTAGLLTWVEEIQDAVVEEGIASFQTVFTEES